MTEAIGTCIIVVNTNGKILLGKRKGGYKPGFYGLPGGRIEANELLHLSAQRELQEETGLIAEKLRYLGVVREWQQTHSFIHFVYTFNRPVEMPENKEPHKCEGWSWYSLNELPDNILLGHMAAIDLLQENKSGIKDLA